MTINIKEISILLGAFLDEVLRHEKLIEAINKEECLLERTKLIDEVAKGYLDVNFDDFIKIIKKGELKIPTMNIKGDC